MCGNSKESPWSKLPPKEGDFVWIASWGCGCVRTIGNGYINPYPNEDEAAFLKENKTNAIYEVDGERIQVMFDGPVRPYVFTDGGLDISYFLATNFPVPDDEE